LFIDDPLYILSIFSGGVGKWRKKSSIIDGGKIQGRILLCLDKRDVCLNAKEKYSSWGVEGTQTTHE
jgi:hypothetical protein